MVDFADEPEEIEHLTVEQIKMEPGPEYLTVWEYDLDGEDATFWLKVDEDSPLEKIEEEYEYWADQLSSFDPPKQVKKHMWRLLQWLEMLIDRAS